MIRDATSLTISVKAGIYFNSEFLLAAQQKYCTWDKLQEGCYIVQQLENVLQRCGNRCEK